MGMDMNLDDQIKILLIENKMKKIELVHKIKEKYGKEQTLTNLSTKLKNETMKYRELREIADILGYEIRFEKKK